MSLGEYGMVLTRNPSTGMPSRRPGGPHTKNHCACKPRNAGDQQTSVLGAGIRKTLCLSRIIHAPMRLLCGGFGDCGACGCDGSGANAARGGCGGVRSGCSRNGDSRGSIAGCGPCGRCAGDHDLTGN